MTSAFDSRIIIVTVTLADGTTYSFQSPLYIRAIGIKGITSQQGQCSVTILNLTQEQRYRILTQASPQKISPQPVLITLQAGRVSTGVFTLFEGYCMASSSGQPPDIGVTFNAVTNNYGMWASLPLQMPENATILTIAEKIADSNNLTLDFEATAIAAKKINNFAYTGAPAMQIKKLNELGVNAYIDNKTLVVLDIGKPRNSPVRNIDANSGMVGIPEVTTYGVRCRLMLDNTVRLGQNVTVTSLQNPAANGKYMIFSMAFEISTRENPFWYDLELYNQNSTAGYNAT